MFAFGRWLISCGRVLAPALLIALLAMAGPFSSAQADDGTATPIDADPNQPTELVVANRPITTLRAMAFGANPAERVEAITDGLEVMLQRGGPLVVSARPIPEGVAIQVDGKFLFRILDGDANQEAGETTAMAADVAVRNLQQALNEVRESRDSQAMLKAIGYTLLATTILAVLLWAVMRGYAYASRRIRAFVELRSDKAGAQLEQPGRGSLRHRRPGGRAGQAGRLGGRPAPRLPVGGTGARILPVHATLGRRSLPQPAGRAGPLRSQHPQRSAGPAVRRADLLRHALHRARRPRILRRRAGGPHQRRAGSTRRPRVPPAGC